MYQGQGLMDALQSLDAWEKHAPASDPQFHRVFARNSTFRSKETARSMVFQLRNLDPAAVRPMAILCLHTIRFTLAAAMSN